MIGAGSVVFSKNLTGDILSYPEFRNAALSYMDVDEERLHVGASLCRKVARGVGAEPKIEATTERRRALDGADFVINMVQIGGFDSTLVDFEIPRKYGLNFTIADTTGPGGLFRALRTYPMLQGLARDMQAVCPGATLLNYSNPMSMNMRTVASAAPGLHAVGLCHSVQGTLNQLMHYIGEDPDSVAFVCAGINHMAFYLELQKNGVDLYPRLFQAMNRPEVYDTNRVRFELMKRLGFFVTESSEHNAEYNPWFIPRGRQVIDDFAVPIDEYLCRCDAIVDQFEQMKARSCSDEPMPHRRSHEYGSSIIHSMVIGTPRVVYGNMPNRGAIASLPTDAIAEAPTLVDRGGCHFTTVGELPPQLLAYMMPHVQQHELFIRAAVEGRRDHVYQACMFDPLTGATLAPDRIVEMCDELIAAHGFAKDGGVLPDLDAKRTLVPSSGKSFDRVDPRVFRDSWCRARRDAEEGIISDWHAIGPFPSGGRSAPLSLRTPIDDELSRSKDGAPNLGATHRFGDAALRWTRAVAGQRGLVNCDDLFGRHEDCVVFGYAEVHSVHPRHATLRVGSDDGIAIWVNGEKVHEHETRRGYRLGSDTVEVRLREGVNRIVIKLSQHAGDWGWGVAISRPTF
mgnify:FL=1